MQPTQFTDAVQAVAQHEPRYDIGAYFFLKEALDFTVKRVMESNDGEHRHVSASELLIGFRDLAMQEFGPMASTMMSEWGLTSCTDIGQMVFLLIEEGVFGKQDSDTREDFAELFPLLETLDAPFLPRENPISAA
ncbi:MAG: Minf_1886 family protein [Akkermansiaceae bacterium]